MLKNLQAEITREGITSEQLASEINVTVRTLKNKLNGVTEFNRDEMYQLRDTFFPKLGVEYLFYVAPPEATLADAPLEFEEQ